MRLKRSNAGVRVCALLSFVVLVAVALPAPSALALTNPERAYEMVSPPYKGGYGVKPPINAVSANGDIVMFHSPGAFAGAPAGITGSTGVSSAYVARRGPSGWSTSPLQVPAALMPHPVDIDVSPSLGSVLASGQPGANYEGATQTAKEQEFRIHSVESPDTAASWELTGPVLRTFPEEAITITEKGASPDFCHILVEPAPLEGLNHLLRGEEGQVGRPLYDVARGCDGEPATVRRVSSDNAGSTISAGCGAQLGIESYATHQSSPTELPHSHNTFNAVADDGKEVFFTDGTQEEGSSCHEEHYQLFVRLGGERTLEVSKPLEEACAEVPCLPASETRANANFVGASEDGSTVFFTTTAPLEPKTDNDSGENLYMARIGCPESEPQCDVAKRVVTSLTQVSADPNGGAAEVQGVVRVAPDGEHVYFVARGDLLSSSAQAVLASEGRPVPHAGADNLYVYDSAAGGVVFIGDLCSGKELSGVAEDLHCPGTESDNNLWSGGGEAQTAGLDGRFLVFATFAQLTAGDTDGARDVYRYDAVTGVLQRVSVGEAGFDANGNDSAFNASLPLGQTAGKSVLEQHELGNRVVSEDGSRIVFRTSEPLSPAAVNGLADVYEWHIGPGETEGLVSLVSSGTSETPDEHFTISPEGNDVFFMTSQGLVAQDTDGVPDIYDARIGGGFPSSAGERQASCEGDACQGPLTNPAPLLVPGSAVQAPGENLPAPPPATVKAKTKAKITRCAKGKKLTHGKCVKPKAKGKQAKKSGHKGSK